MSEQLTPSLSSDAIAVAEKPTVPSVKAILARKIGMTRVYTPQGEFVPVTVLEAGPCPILEVKTMEKHGYTALQLAFGAAKAKNTSKPLAGHFAKSQTQPTRWIREVRVKTVEGFQAGQKICADNFVAGDAVDVSGYSKGKGFAGAVKRHRFKGGPTTHGQSDRLRAPGSSSAQGSQNVFKGKRGPGHMGHDWITQQRLTVFNIDAEKNLLLLEGSVPGPIGSCVTVRQTSRPRKFRKAPTPPAAVKKVAAKAEKKK
jgi:large subunit ribosomal protein L3